MKTQKTPLVRHANLIRWGAVALTLLFFLSLFYLLPDQSQNRVAQALWVLVALGASGLVYVLIGQWLGFMDLQSIRQEQVEADQKQIERLQKRLETVLKINGQLVDAEDEKSLMVSLLNVIAGYLGANGASYIPVDEWGQPLATVNVGSVPLPEMDQWLERLNSSQVQQLCKECQVLQASTGGSCPLGQHPFTTCQGITCLQLNRNDHLLGIMNFYRPSQEPLDEETRTFLSGLLGEMAFAVETIRLRRQELATLRQLQLARDPKMELSALLRELLLELQQALEADYAYLAIVQGGEKNTGLLVEGRPVQGSLDPAWIDHLVLQTLPSAQKVFLTPAETVGLPTDVRSFLAAPVRAAEGQPLGVLLVGSTRLAEYNPLQLRVIDTIVSQASLFIQNDRHIQEMEYRAVMDERSRLAREIHDGLAQTLAFLKMQAAQMQNYLAREDLPHLREVLRTNYRTLSDAYVDARQAIDYLRVTPEAGMQSWLEQAAIDFQSGTDMDVQLSIQMERANLSSEIQAQIIRVVQEALSNIRKHARATRVSISLREWQKDLILEISDNGQGYSPEDVPGISQYGLRGMRERAELIGADFQIVSQPHQGTTVRLRLPYPYEETPV